ncbi:DUF2189 domain-containing protein [Hoeflea sp. TYP-13]|uniref:DUF2189 domain-containing protein n=1 Tax=Hoeflea sp. TYP-13 TaxID=3230023 RepID=UPI0034C5CC72
MGNIHVITDAQGAVTHPQVQKITNADVIDALKKGLDDFWDKPSHYVFLCLIYPIVGVVLITWTSGGNALQLVYPLMAGFALLGPIAAIGLYEISRRREQNLDTSWRHALDVTKSPAIPAILAVGAMLVVLFVAWMYAAQALYQGIYGPSIPASIWAFAGDVLTTQQGWTLIIVGNAVGFVFALVVLCTTVIAFPLLLDRDVGAYAAIETSVRAVAANPVQMVFWGLIVAIALLIGSIPLLVGLAIVIPVLGHATWHLYRKLIKVPSSE